MYCQNCGKKCDEKAVVCVGCGAALNNSNFTNTSNKKGKGIASMVLGIIGALYALLAFASFDKLDSALVDIENQVAFAVGFVLVQSVFAIIAVCLSTSERKNFKNGYNTAGFWLSITTFVLVAIQFIYVVTY